MLITARSDGIWFAEMYLPSTGFHISTGRPVGIFQLVLGREVHGSTSFACSSLSEHRGDIQVHVNIFALRNGMRRNAN